MVWHTRTVVRECCKDDDQCQWERPKFDPTPPLNPLTDRHQNLPTLLRRGYLPSWKISSRSDKGFRFCACAISRIKLFTRLFVRFFGSSSRLQPRRTHGFWRKIRQKTRFRARTCLLGVAKPKVKLFTPSRLCIPHRTLWRYTNVVLLLFAPKPPFWGPFSTGLGNFRSKTLLTLDMY